ncbi:methyltransferase domain-containing protein [Nonomuraea sp. KC401]|uniref:class I SAM-dependent DNA methyltransferase n=1 Tax=unclassified Nonomuraea TaxID=2593643 RepID=UPI0010FCFCB3|nr:MULTISPECIES: class I SAM-dependent methyltransferase [unclassified Nonomuraea]NBE97088.1 methyltransferase domain-containing protein [Nonomuraea sp. K271]TLF66150.1 methyltransferase domain-containing protein [Nonomuraea sp. KC401]
MPFHVHPLAWLLALEGVALLRAQAGDIGGEENFVARRIAEIRRLCADPELARRTGAVVGHASTVEGYAQWAGSYDSEENPLIAVEEPQVRRILAALPPGRALDAACGTGRHAAFLAGLGHEVVGVDSSAEMLALARAKTPDGTFHEADLHDLPIEPTSFDLVVCGLALTHQPALGPALREFAKVVRPGGHIVLSDIHVLSLYLGGVAKVTGPDGGLRAMPAGRFLAGDYIAAIREAGLEIVACHEPRWGEVPGGHGGPLAQQWCPEAAELAYRDTPAVIIWHLRRPLAGDSGPLGLNM